MTLIYWIASVLRTACAGRSQRREYRARLLRRSASERRARQRLGLLP